MKDILSIIAVFIRFLVYLFAFLLLMSLLDDIVNAIYLVMTTLVDIFTIIFPGVSGFLILASLAIWASTYKD